MNKMKKKIKNPKIGFKKETLDGFFGIYFMWTSNNSVFNISLNVFWWNIFFHLERNKDMYGSYFKDK